MEMTAGMALLFSQGMIWVLSMDATIAPRVFVSSTFTVRVRASFCPGLEPTSRMIPIAEASTLSTSVPKQHGQMQRLNTSNLATVAAMRRVYAFSIKSRSRWL